MTTREADQAIKSGQPITVHSVTYDETFTITIVSRDRWTIKSDTGGVFERDELEIV